MGTVGRDLFGKRLAKLLSATKDEELFQLIWSVDALQSGREDVARRYLSFPADAATSDMSANSAVYKWELETLANRRLLTSVWRAREGKNRYLNHRSFGAASALVNCLRSLENADYGARSDPADVFKELHRISYRQFPWQRGFLNVRLYYRSAFIYGQGKCAEHVLQRYGINFNDFSLIGFGFFSVFLQGPIARPSQNLAELGVDSQKVSLALKAISISYEEARKAAVKMQNLQLGIAHQPSLIRQYPIIRFPGDKLRAPLPALLSLRITSGIYYDLVGGGQKLLGEASDRFEQYTYEYLQAQLPAYSAHRSRRYQIAGNNYDTPDVRLLDSKRVAVAIECKATKMTFLAQFGKSPADEAKRVFDEIAAGIFQIWRYFSHARRHLIDEDCETALGLVLTLDPWFILNSDIRQRLFDTADQLADDEGDILSIDRRPIAICSIEGLENLLDTATEESFYRAISVATTDARYQGWLLDHVHREIREAGQPRKPFPFRVDDVLPWWSELERLKSARNNNSGFR